MYCGRGNCPVSGKPGLWGNPYSEKSGTLATYKVATRGEAIAKHRADVLADPDIQKEIRRELKGKRLGCWCSLNETCHCDVYVEIADYQMSNPILIDADNLIRKHIALSATDDLKANGTFTGGVWGTINSLAPMLARPELDAGEIFAFFDAGVPSFRKSALPDYKAKRKEKKKDMSEADHQKMMGQMHLTRQMFELLGIVCVAYKDREADDGCAAASQIYCDHGRTPIIISGDKDLLQCLKWGARVWDNSKKLLIGSENFEETMGVPLYRWLLYRTLVGDPSDGIKGATGVGEGTAKKIIEWLDGVGLTGGDAEDQLLDVTSLLLGKFQGGTDAKGFTQLSEKAPEWAKGVINDLDRLQREMTGIDLSHSFGNTTALAKKLTERPEPQPKAFLQFCLRLHFNSVLSDPDRSLAPFRNAAKRRPLL